MPERARTDPWEPQGSNPLGPPGHLPPPKQSPAPSVEHVENHTPPGECRLGREIHGFFPRYPSFVNLVAVTNGTRIRINVLRINDLRSTLTSIRVRELYINNIE